MPGRLRLFSRVTIASLAAIGIVAAQGPGQPAGDDQPVSPFRTEANYVRVDVFVTRNGEPVTDLGPEDFEILDQGVPQTIFQVDYVRVRGNAPENTRREPGTVAESREMLQESRARVFVLFLDTRHVDAAASRTISRSLVTLLDDLLGIDDLIAVMTPDMPVTSITFGRKTGVLRSLLEQEWWGERDRLVTSDPVERQYEVCYPPDPLSPSPSLARELIERRREVMTLDALDQLVRYLRDAREERKALLVISPGWRLFERDPRLLQQRVDREPPIGTLGPIGNRPSQRADISDQLFLACERDRQTLALLDNESRFRELMDHANRANASFYPVDPRGLVLFDSAIGPDPPPAPGIDRAWVRARELSLRELADRTDGLAVVSTNDITGGLRRVVADLSSYYLLGYYATGVEMDGRFHRITVRVRRPGVEVRARPGYLAPTRGAMTAERRIGAAETPPGEAAARRGLEQALGSLDRLSREMPLRVEVAAAWTSGGSARFHVVGELGRSGEWAAGADVDVALTTPDGRAMDTGEANVGDGARQFDLALVAGGPVAPGEYTVRVRARSRAADSSSTSEVVTVSLPDAPDGTGALFFRRGPSTANRDAATADRRFRRTERVRVELPGREGERPAARLLGRTGSELAVPVATTLREADDGTWWVSAELALAPLAVGDYVLEVSGAATRDGTGSPRQVWIGFRVVP